MARQQAAREWNAEFFNPQNPIFQKMYSGRRAVGTGAQQQACPASAAADHAGSSACSSAATSRTKVRDVSGTVIMLAQAPIIGVLLALVFGGQKDAIPYWCLGALQELATSLAAGWAIDLDDLLRT